MYGAWEEDEICWGGNINGLMGISLPLTGIRLVDVMVIGYWRFAS